MVRKGGWKGADDKRGRAWPSLFPLRKKAPAPATSSTARWPAPTGPPHRLRTRTAGSDPPERAQRPRHRLLLDPRTARRLPVRLARPCLNALSQPGTTIPGRSPPRQAPRPGAAGNARTGHLEQRTVSGAEFLWLVLQHVLPKVFRRARNFGFLHPNCKRLIALLQVLLKFAPDWPRTQPKERAPIRCPCCVAAMAIERTRTRSAGSGALPGQATVCNVQ